jgi:hypothetical protein
LLAAAVLIVRGRAVLRVLVSKLLAMFSIMVPRGMIVMTAMHAAALVLFYAWRAFTAMSLLVGWWGMRASAIRGAVSQRLQSSCGEGVEVATTFE